MTSLLAALCGMLAVGGVLLLVTGCIPHPPSDMPQPSTARSTGLWTSARRRWMTATRRERLVVALGAASGPAAIVITGMPVTLVVVPVLVVVVPWLLRTPPNRDVLALEALDRWVRLLASSMPTGKSVPDAIRATARQVPERLRVPVRTLVLRLDERWTTREALGGFADEVASADADAVVAALILAAERGGRGASRTLAELSDAVQSRLRALREVEAEREKPRIVVRQVTWITLAMVAGVMVLRSDYFRPLGSPVGQLVVLVVTTAYIGALAMMRVRTRPRLPQRLLGTGTAVRDARTA